MPVFKDEARGTWYVMVRYQDWTGERKQKCKRGFATKREAQEWERSFQMQTSGDLDMTFEAFTELYTKDMKPRLKENTWLTKENIIQKKILPYFGKRKISEITTKDVIAWQNELLAYRDEKRKPYSATYLKTLHNQLSAIFNHAVRFYELRSNPAAKVWGDRIFEKCGIGRDEGGDGGKTLEIRGKRRLSARDGGANYQQS